VQSVAELTVDAGAKPVVFEPAAPPTTSAPEAKPGDDPVFRLAYPSRVAAGPGSALCVSDFEAGRVVCRRAQGALAAPGFETSFVIPGLDRPLGLALLGSRVYVGSLGNGSVQVYDASKRRFLPALGAGLGEFSMPNSIAVASDGTAYVADSSAHVVKVYGPSGNLLKTLGGRGSANGQFIFPVAVAVDGTRLIVGDQGNHRLQVFDRDGRWQRSVGEPVPASISSAADFKGRFTRIQGVALHGDTTLVLDSYHSHVQAFDGDFATTGFFGRAGDCDSCLALGLDVAVDASGRILVTDPERSRWVTLPGVAP
jgi:DNA-binding beta-propeller fold protein YncE